ncbi:MAG: hypothetical protein V2A74_04025 [bacterium]
MDRHSLGLQGATQFVAGPQRGHVELEAGSIMTRHRQRNTPLHAALPQVFNHSQDAHGLFHSTVTHDRD